MSVRVLWSRAVWLAPVLSCVLAACGGAPSVNVGAGSDSGDGTVESPRDSGTSLPETDAGNVGDAGTCPGSGSDTCSGEDSGTGSDAGTDTGSGSDAGSGPALDAGVEPDTDAGTDTGTDAGTSTGPDGGVEPGTDAGTDVDAGSAPDAGGGTDTDAGTEVDAGSAPDAGTSTGPDGGVEPDTDAGTEVDAGSAPDADGGTDTDAGTDVDAGSAPDAGVEPGTDAGTETGTDAGTAPLTANTDGDKVLCAGGSTSIGLPASGGVPPYAYAWSASPVCTGCFDSASVVSPTVTPPVTTTFTQTVTDALSQTAWASTLVTVLPNPGSAGADLTLDPGASAIIGPTPVSGATYAWSCNRADCSLSASNVAQPVAGPTHTTTYTLESSSGPGCDVRSSMTVWVNLTANTIPEDGEVAFPLKSALLVQFDQPIAPATLTSATVQLQEALTGNPVAMTFSYDATSRQLRVVPTGANYVASTEYTLTLMGGLSGIASDDSVQPNLFPSDVQVDFTTAAADTTPPGITFRSPTSGAVDVASNTSVVVTFDEPVDAAKVTGSQFKLSSAAGAVTGTVRYDAASRTATFTPMAPLASSTVYTVSLENIQDLSGNAMTTPVSWTFTTGMAADTTPPTVTSVNPVNGATAVASSDPLQVTFSENVDIASLTGIRLLQVSNGTSVAGNVSYNATTRVATFTPTVLLGSLTTYEVNVSEVKDLAGNAMAAPFTSRFTTRRTLFSDYFESGTGAWVLPAPGVGTPWRLTTANFHSARNSLTDSAGGKYVGNVVSSAELAAPLSVSGLTSVTVQFWMKVRTEKNKDFVYVDASIDGGAWTQISGGRYAGNLAWAVRSLNLPLSGRSTLRIRFRFESNATKSFDGVYIDDVIIQSP